MRALLVTLLLSAPGALAKDPACARSCDDLLKTLSADCRKAAQPEKHGGKHGGDKHEDSHNDGEACQSVLKKMRTACLKDCQGEPAKKRR